MNTAAVVGPPPQLLSVLALSNTVVLENVAAGTVVGALSGMTAGSTVTLTGTSGGKFALSGNNIVTAGTIDRETAASHIITVTETLAGYANSPRISNFTITVTDVPAPTASGSIADRVVAQGAAISAIDCAAVFTVPAGSGAATYSLAPTSAALPAGLSLNATTGQITGTPTTIAAAATIVIRCSTVEGPADVGFQITVQATAPADYVVTTDAEWNAAFANSDATLSGKIVEVSGANFTERTIAAGRVFNPALTIRSADANGKLPSLVFNGNHTGVHLKGLNVQIAGWPATTPYGIKYRAGTGYNYKMIGCTIRHGYGPSHLPFVTDFDYPEFGRGNHPITADVTSATVAVTWQDPAMTQGWVEFMNNGANPVYVKFNTNATDAATTADTLCPAGARTRLTAPNPQNATYCHFISTGGQSACRFTTDIGMTAWLASAFDREGGAFLSSPEFRGNLIEDVSNGFKYYADPLGDWIVMDNHLRRIYQDVFSGRPPADTGRLYFLRNLAQMPFCRAGITTTAPMGDARDPHGDFRQFFDSTNGANDKRVTSAGNRMYSGPLRAGAGNQGAHYWEPLTGSKYLDCYAIGDMLMLNSNNALSFNGPNQHVYVLGCTAINVWDATAAAVAKMPGSQGNNFMGDCVAGNFSYGPSGDHAGNVGLQGVNKYSLFPNWDSILASTDKATAEAAMVTAGAAAGAGALAWSNAIDWVTTDHLSVIKWNLTRAGIQWPIMRGVAPGSLVTAPVRKLLGGPASSAITANAGAEYQIVSDLAGTTVLVPWTSASGTISRGQFVQMRATASAAYLTATSASITINGETISLPMMTAPDPATIFDTAPGTYFEGPTIGAGVSKIHYKAVLKLPAYPGTSRTLFNLSAARIVVDVMTDGSLRSIVRDSTNTILVNNRSTSPVLTVGAWHTIEVAIDLVSARYVVLVDGAVVDDLDIPSVGTGLLESGRFPVFMAKNAGTTQLSAAVYELSVWKTADPTGLTPAYPAFKTIYGPAATANADTWKRGPAAT